MSKILVVGNVMKDVYLNLDSRIENFESDADGVKWLNVRFDASDHHFFRRNSSFGGAAVSLEVLLKMGLDAKISGSDINFENGSVVSSELPGVYRYILVADEQQISYFTPSDLHVTKFDEPDEAVDWVFVDRSVELTEQVAAKIEKYLDKFPDVKFAVYLKKAEQFHERRFIGRADLIFAEEDVEGASPEHLVIINDKYLEFGGTKEPLRLSRPDLSTHLSLYSAAAATILGAHILGQPIEKALKLARANLENSQLDATLGLERMETLAANYADNLEQLRLVAKSLLIGKKEIFDLTAAEKERKQQFLVHGTTETYSNRQDYYGDLFLNSKFLKNYSGIALTDEAMLQYMGDGRSFVDYLTSRRVMPGVIFDMSSAKITEISEKECPRIASRLGRMRQAGACFVLWDMKDIDGVVEKAVKFVRCCIKSNIVPVLKLSNQLERTSQKILDSLADEGLDTEVCVILH